MEFEREKTQQLLAYIASKLDVGKTKLMKLLYLIDFTAYERTGKSVTNDEYQHWDLGPVPTNTWRGMREGLIEGVLNTSEEQRVVGTYIRYTPVTENPETSLLTPAELRIIDEVIDQYGTLGQQELVEMLHKELPCRITAENERIPYLLAPYRNYQGLTKAQLNKLRSDKKLMARLRAALKESQKPEYQPILSPAQDTAA